MVTYLYFPNYFIIQLFNWRFDLSSWRTDLFCWVAASHNLYKTGLKCVTISVYRADLRSWWAGKTRLNYVTLFVLGWPTLLVSWQNRVKFCNFLCSGHTWASHKLYKTGLTFVTLCVGLPCAAGELAKQG